MGGGGVAIFLPFTLFFFWLVGKEESRIGIFIDTIYTLHFNRPSVAVGRGIARGIAAFTGIATQPSTCSILRQLDQFLSVYGRTINLYPLCFQRLCYS